MEGDSPKRRSQLTYDDRLLIERGLNRGDPIGTIARTIGRDASTVKREVERNWTESPRGMLAVETRNICSRRHDCRVHGLCRTLCARECRKCGDWKCNALCPDFEAVPCERLGRAPHCCNSCDRRLGRGCDHPYRFYEAKYADDLAKSRRREARRGLDITEEGLIRSLEAIREGLERGQSPAHIIRTDDRVQISKSTFYRLLDGAKAGDLCKMHLPKAVRYRPRSKASAPSAPSIPRALLKGRAYQDFMNLPVNVRENAVEMDTVVGRLGRDRQCILTLYFRRLHYQIYMLLPSHDSECVVGALNDLESLCGKMYPRLFGTILTDRGTEFSDVIGIERDRHGRKRTDLYFCNPTQSQQKGACERNHVELRRILPKGKTDFDALTKSDMARIMSHINSYSRKSIDWFAPYDMARAVLPPGLLEGLGVERVEPRRINLTPQLVPHAIVK